MILLLVIGVGYVAIWFVIVPRLEHRRKGVAMLCPSQRGKFSKSGQKGPRGRGRGRGRSVRFGGLNVLYDEAGNEYPADDAGQLYVPLGYQPAVTEEMIEEENTKEIKN